MRLHLQQVISHLSHQRGTLSAIYHSNSGLFTCCTSYKRTTTTDLRSHEVLLQVRSTFEKEVVNCIYKPCPSAQYSVVQSGCSICHLANYIIVGQGIIIIYKSNLLDPSLLLRKWVCLAGLSLINLVFLFLQFQLECTIS